jgi:site-specific DNA recombinase
VTLRSVMEPIDDSPTGKLMEGVLSTFAQFDNDQNAERTKSGMQAAIGRGRWTFKVPLGYTNGVLRSDPSLLPDPDRAPFVREAFRQVADGRPVVDVLAWTNAAGCRTLRGV